MQPSYRRLQSVLRGVDGGRRHSPHNEPAAAVAAPSLADPAMDSRPAKLLSDRDVQEFIRSGWMSHRSDTALSGACWASGGKPNPHPLQPRSQLRFEDWSSPAGPTRKALSA